MAAPFDLMDTLASVRRAAWRIEQQDIYAAALEPYGWQSWQTGTPRPPTNVAVWNRWADLVRDLRVRGVEMIRVRIEAEPPTPYQEWARWLGRWNTAVGEELRYLPRSAAEAQGLTDTVGRPDYWILDDQAIMLDFGHDGHLVGTPQPVTDTAVAQAVVDTWHRLAALAVVDPTVPDAGEARAGHD